MQPASITRAAAASGAATASTTEEVLDKDAFLQLLITQIRFQDPLSPMEDREFIAQLAQFSTLEQMQELNAGFWTFQQMSATTQALALVGRRVTAHVPGETEPLTGTVEAVTFRDGIPVLLVGEREVELAWVGEVR